MKTAAKSAINRLIDLPLAGDLRGNAPVGGNDFRMKQYNDNHGKVYGRYGQNAICQANGHSACPSYHPDHPSVLLSVKLPCFELRIVS